MSIKDIQNKSVMVATLLPLGSFSSKHPQYIADGTIYNIATNETFDIEEQYQGMDFFKEQSMIFEFLSDKNKEAIEIFDTSVMNQIPKYFKKDKCTHLNLLHRYVKDTQQIGNKYYNLIAKAVYITIHGYSKLHNHVYEYIYDTNKNGYYVTIDGGGKSFTDLVIKHLQTKKIMLSMIPIDSAELLVSKEQYKMLTEIKEEIQ